VKRSLVICTFNYGGTCHQGVVDYIADLLSEIHDHPVFGLDKTGRLNVNTTPVDMARNRAIVNCEEYNADYCLMIDSDMMPDLYLDINGKPKEGSPNAKKFFTSSINWMLEQDYPTIVAAPYCGPPPHENIYVFQWSNRMSDDPNPNFSVGQYNRTEAALMEGITPVAALPTGLMLIDMRVFKKWPHPRFYYEFTDQRCVEKASTEDVTFSRDALLLGNKYYGGKPICHCNWDAWAGHVKEKVVGKPSFVRPDDDVLETIKKGMNFYARIRQVYDDVPQLHGVQAVDQVPDAIKDRSKAVPVE
jgi:hypothetical protein